MPIEALIFDCDGTLADSMPLHWRAWKQVTERHGIQFPEDRFYSLGGVPARDILKMLGEEQGRPMDYAAVAREKEAAFEQMIPQIPLVGLIAKIARENYGKLPLAVASGGTRRVITQTLHHLGIAHLFQAVVVSEDVARQKPAPDIYLEAARRLGVAPRNCRAYEDTDLGLAAIRAAGMEAVDVRPLLAAG
ncbi:MAG: HAD family phosphatase [Verrucomicrobiota bacterium]|jgi:beta-phosphoglucomutase-like phosphatase (HAD superfamily)